MDNKKELITKMCLTKSEINIIRNRYPAGTRIELIEMDDVHAPPIGTKGVVKGVDDIGNILVDWDNGSRLNVIYGVDKIKTT